MRLIATVTFPTAPAPEKSALIAAIEGALDGEGGVKSMPEGLRVKLGKGKLFVELFDPSKPGGMDFDEEFPDEGDDQDDAFDAEDEEFDAELQKEMEELFGDDEDDPFAGDWDAEDEDGEEDDAALYLHIAASKKARPKEALGIVGALMALAEDAVAEDEMGFPLPVREMLADREKSAAKKAKKAATDASEE